MCNLEFSTEGTRCSKQVPCSRRSARWDDFLISLSLSLPSSISELITRTLVNRVRSRWPQKCSRTHDLRRSELGSRFVVHCGGEREGEIAAQRVNAASAISLSLSLPLSLPLSLSLPPSGESQCGSTLYWIMLEHECTRTISKTRSREVLTEREGTPCPSSSQTKSKSLREGGGNCPRTNSWTMKVLGFGMRIGLGRNTDRIGIDRDWCKKKKEICNMEGE